MATVDGFSAGGVEAGQSSGQGLAADKTLPMRVEFTVPVEIVSEANRRDHWAVAARRAKKQKHSAYESCLEAMGYKAGEKEPSMNFCVTLMRVMGKRQRPFDGDNLQRGFKAVRDGVAQCLGIDDGSERMTWNYAQERGAAAGVRVEIEGEGK